jgi:glutamate---cysteine ligase / carboxylate-amine ligase
MLGYVPAREYRSVVDGELSDSSGAIVGGASGWDGIARAATSRRAFDAAATDMLTLGVEEEFLLVEDGGDALAPVAAGLLAALAPDRSFAHELRAAQIEALTPVCLTAADIERELTSARTTIARAAAGIARLVAVPVNPGSADPGPPTEHRRYRRILAGAPWASRAHLTCGMHLHLGVGDADRAVVLHDALRSYLPLLGALAANSPIFDGADAGVASARPQLKQLLPRFGVPPAFGSWRRYEEYLRWGSTGGVIADPSYLWHELRLNPMHGTVEIRVFDVQTDVSHAGALTALTQALAAWLLARHEDGEVLPTHDHHRIQEALWLAARDGATGALPDLDTGTMIPVDLQLMQLLSDIRPHAAAIGSASHLDRIRTVQQVPGHERQRHVFAHSGVTGLVDWLAHCTDERQAPSGYPGRGGELRNGSGGTTMPESWIRTRSHVMRAEQLMQLAAAHPAAGSPCGGGGHRE